MIKIKTHFAAHAADSRIDPDHRHAIDGGGTG